MLNSYHKFLIFIFAGLVSISPACIHTHDMTIYGKVKNPQGKAIYGALISIDPDTAFSKVYTGTSDAFGMYSIDEGQFDVLFVNELLDPTHEIIIVVAHPEYKSYRANVTFKDDVYRYDIILENP